MAEGTPMHFEGLRHSPKEKIVSLCKLPNGDTTVGYTYSGKEWVFIHSTFDPAARQIRRQLKHMGIESRLGDPINVAESDQQQKVIIIESTPEDVPLHGIYVNPEHVEEISKFAQFSP